MSTYTFSAILDKARSHVSLTRKAARLLFMATAAFVLLIGSMRLQSKADQLSTADVVEALPAKAQDETPPADVKKGEAEPSDNFRTMEVRITDEEGQPLEGAKLYIGVWYTKGYQGEKVPKEYIANSDGVVNLKLPHRLLILRLWPSKPGYVPEFVNFGMGKHEEGKLIPDRYEFQLASGTKLSGTVIDESGQPVSGVTVDVSVEVSEPGWGVNPKSMISRGLTDEDFFEGPVYTDKDGKWQINNAPAQTGKNDYKFRLKFTHMDYASDGEYGELQSQQHITTATLRDGTAKIVLSRGKRVTGTVVDSSGNPVTNGYVVWRHVAYGNAKEFETNLDDSGSFETSPLPQGKHPFTVIGQGFLPEHRTVTVASTMTDLNFELKPGKRLTVKVVDPDGTPIPNAYFHVGSWLSVEPVFNGGQSSVFHSRIPRNADDEGVFVWDGAPADGVTYRISARGFSSDTVTLVANDTEHIVKLLPLLVATGQVTDAMTGKPIKEFRVVPITVFRPKFLSTAFHDEVIGRDGKYEVNLADNAERNYRYQVRIDADGYRTAIGEGSFELRDGRVTQDFALEPAAARTGKVVDGQGKPVASAAVIEGTPSSVPSMRNAEVGWSGRSVATSSAGRFQLAATSEPVRIRVTHELGFAEVLRQPDEAIGTIRLQSWAMVSGRLLQAGKPVPDQSIFFFPVPSGKLGEPRFQDLYNTKTDADGHFEFERLPPIAGSIRALLGPWRDSPLTSSLSVPLDLNPGEHRNLKLGGEGIAVTGQVVATGRGDAKLSKQWSLNYLISRDRGIELPADVLSLGFDPNDRVQSSWFLDQGYADWLATREYYFVKLTPEGQLHVSGVPPGRYDLVLQLYEQPVGCLVETVGEKVVTVEVTESDQASGTKDLGVIEVECRSGPRVGESMQAYRFTDSSGRERTVQQMKGRYVLMHVWASWCAPCIEHMPDVQATFKSLSDQPITFVGLNIDKETAQAKQIAQRGAWNWSQNYLGDDSDMARQLAISSVPTYFLIGPDGLLVASSKEWLKIKTTLKSLLNETSD